MIASGAPLDLRQAVLICNAQSRRGREWYPAVKAKLEEQGFHLLWSHDARDPTKIRPMVERAVAEEVPLIVVGGGDGTMSNTAAALKGSSSILGVLPLGTGNAFARDLGIPADVDGACRVLVEGVPRDVDLGLVNGKHFVNVATVGLTTRIAENLTDEGKRRFGRFIYAFAVAKAVTTLRPFRVRLTVDDAVHEFTTMQVVVGSGRFHAGPFPVTPDAEITDRMLHGYALRGTSKGSLLKLALTLWGGRHVDLPEVESFAMKAGRVETSPSRRVTVDGEVYGRTPIELAIDPGAVRVMTAAEFPGVAESPRSETTGEMLGAFPNGRTVSAD